MKAFARAIAAIFMILGVIVIMTGIGVVVSGFTAPKPAEPTFPGLMPDYSGLILFARMVVGGVIGFQGLLLAAIGEVLWLLAAIAEQSERTSEYMGFLASRLSPSNK